VPSRLEHLAKAESNQVLAVALLRDRQLDWSVTVLFYAALHLVEATLAPQTHSANHRDRFDNVKYDPRLSPIHDDDRYLYDLSLRSRYDCRVFTAPFVQALYATRYVPIKRHLQPLLGFTF
jgi:hypothetical protein